MRILITIIIIFSNSIIFSQRSNLGIVFGTSYYIGDLNPGGHFKYPKPAGGIIYRYNVNTRYALKGNILYGTLIGDDSKSKDPYQQNRNLSFSSSIFEISGQLEFNFFPFICGNLKYHYSPYVFIGASFFSINPKTKIYGETYELHLLGTEGQGLSSSPDNKPYSSAQIGIPFGLGFKFNKIKNFSFCFEWGLRKTFTDYIDDVSTIYIDKDNIKAENGNIASELTDRSINSSINKIGKQRGNSTNNDIYSFALLMITYKINGNKVKCDAYNNKYN